MNVSMANLRFGLPSKGSLGDDSMDLLRNAGLRVHKPNARQYSASIPSLEGVEVFLQRPTDIFHKVQDGTLDVGIIGFDIMNEYSDLTDIRQAKNGAFLTSDDVIMALKLGFGAASLVIAVPESWLDVSSVADLADLAINYKDKSKKLRVATTFSTLTRNWLYRKGITNFTLVKAEGALEVAPSMGYADIIADLTATGTTLKENRLKTIKGGTILESEAILICNAHQLRQNVHKRNCLKDILELIDANLHARQYVTVMANIRGESREQVGRLLIEETDLSGLVGPSVVEVFSKPSGTDSWYEVSLVIERSRLLETMEHLRHVRGKDITVSYPQYVFGEASQTHNDVTFLLDNS